MRNLTITLHEDDKHHPLIELGPQFIRLNHYGDNTYSAYFKIEGGEITCIRSFYLGHTVGDHLKPQYATMFADITAVDIERIVTEFVENHD